LAAGVFQWQGREARTGARFEQQTMELVRNLMVECVSRLELGTPLCMRPEQTIRESVGCLREQQLGYVLVCRGGRLVGILTERDLLRRVIAVVRSLENHLEEVMTPEPVVAFPGMPIATAVRRMQEGGYRHLPVVDTMSRPLGVLS